MNVISFLQGDNSMNKKSKYYFIISRLLIIFISTLVIGGLIRIATIYQYLEPNLFSSIIIIFRVFNSLLIIALIFGGIYLIYQLYAYFSSAFYRDYKVNILEALQHGIVDMHFVYDKAKILFDGRTIKVDFANNIITVSKKNKHYSFLFIDLFGVIEGKENSDNWFSVRRPQKKYGKTSYAVSIRFQNPILVSQKYAEELKKGSGNDYSDFVVISGFYKMECQSKKIIPIYEINSIANLGTQD